MSWSHSYNYCLLQRGNGYYEDSEDVNDSTVMHINDFPRPNSTLTRHLLDSNGDNSNEYLLLKHGIGTGFKLRNSI